MLNNLSFFKIKILYFFDFSGESYYNFYMKVSSGKFGGRKLAENKFDHIRPTADIVKQAIFNRLTDEVVGAKVLDLFCGTGALGIEALSRGASEVIFVDKDKRSIMLTNTNLKSLNIQAKTINRSEEHTSELQSPS